MPLGMTQEQMAHYGNKTHPLNMSSENVFKTPIKSMYGTGRQPNNGKYPDAWGSSPFTDHLKKTGRIQSVPPWFVCSDKRSDGKVHNECVHDNSIRIYIQCIGMYILYCNKKLSFFYGYPLVTLNVHTDRFYMYNVHDYMYLYLYMYDYMFMYFTEIKIN